MISDTTALLFLIPTLWGLFGYMVYKDINPLTEIIQSFTLQSKQLNNYTKEQQAVTEEKP